MTDAPETPHESEGPQAFTGEEYRHVEAYLLGDDPHLTTLSGLGIIKKNNLQDLHSRIAVTLTVYAAKAEEYRKAAKADTIATLTRSLAEAEAKIATVTAERDTWQGFCVLAMDHGLNGNSYYDAMKASDLGKTIKACLADPAKSAAGAK